MLIKTRGIVLRAIKYSETSLIVEIYTEELGLQKYIISGVRSTKPQVKASLLQVMSLLDLVVYHREQRDLHRVRELRPAHVYQSIPFDIRRGAVGLFMAEVVQKTIRESEEHRPLFDFLYDSFFFLDQTQQPVTNLHLHFLVHLTGYLGFLPAGDFSDDEPIFDMKEGHFTPESPGHVYFLDETQSRLLYEFLQTDREESHVIQINGVQRRELLKHLIDFYRLHIEHLPEIQSHRILQEVLE